MYKTSMFKCISLIFIILPILLKASHSINSLTKRQLTGPFGGGPFTFVMTPLEPMCECQLDNTNFTNYKGASVQLLRDLIKSLEWTESDYIVTCKTWDDMFDYVKENNNSLAISGITITNPRILLGYQFSFPTFQAPFSMLVRDISYQMLFLRPYTTQFALILLITIIILAIFVKVTEGEGSYLEFFYQQIANLFISGDEASTFGGRAIGIMFWILGLVLTEMYISHIAEFMIYHAAELETPNSLINKHVLSMPPAINILFSYSAYATEFPGGLGPAELHKLITLDENSEYKGAVSDDHIVSLAAHIYCDVHRELANFFMANLGMMFGPNTLTSTIDLFNQHLVTVVENNKNHLEVYIEEEYMDQKCENSMRVEQLDIDHMAELWYIFLVFLGLATIVYLAVKHYKKYKKGKKKAKVSEESNPDKDRTNKSYTKIYNEQPTAKRIIPTLDEELNVISTLKLSKIDITSIQHIKHAFSRANTEEPYNLINVQYLKRIEFNGENYISTISEINHKFEFRIEEIICNNLDRFKYSLDMKIEPIWNLLFGISDEYLATRSEEYRPLTAISQVPRPIISYSHSQPRSNISPILNIQPELASLPSLKQLTHITKHNIHK